MGEGYGSQGKRYLLGRLQAEVQLSQEDATELNAEAMKKVR